MPAPEPAAPAAPPPAEPAGTIADSAATLPALPILAPEPPRSPRAPAKSEPAKVATSPTTAPAPTTATTAATAAPANPVRSFAELTPEARARLPVVNVSGSTYSQNPAHRMLIINGKVVQEGAEIAPGLTLETIEQRSAVLNHQGLRYRIGY
jgi:general secretion pathway protein B